MSIGIESTADLHGDADNPRQISDDSEHGLRRSLEEFGDLSGIVFNLETGDLVCGHQRMKQLRSLYGDQPIVTLDAEAELGGFRVSPTRVFPVRVVRWSEEKQRAANVTANNQKLAGTFSDDLPEYLLTVADSINDEMPGLMDDVMLTQLLSDCIDTGDEPIDSFSDDPGNALENMTVLVGSHRFKVTIDEMIAWDQRVKEEVGANEEDICNYIAQKLSLRAA